MLLSIGNAGSDSGLVPIIQEQISFSFGSKISRDPHVTKLEHVDLAFALVIQSFSVMGLLPRLSRPPVITLGCDSRLYAILIEFPENQARL